MVAGTSSVVSSDAIANPEKEGVFTTISQGGEGAFSNAETMVLASGLRRRPLSPVAGASSNVSLSTVRSGDAGGVDARAEGSGT